MRVDDAPYKYEFEDLLVIANYKMDKIEELESRMDKYLELESRKQCLLELHSFALEQLGRYRGMNKDKQHFGLLELPSKGENALKDAVDFYIEQQYYCYCQYLRECLDDVDKEWVEIGINNGYFDSNKDKMP